MGNGEMRKTPAANAGASFVFDPNNTKNVLSAEELTKEFGSKQDHVLAVDHVDFNFRESEIVSIVGESGSGKTTVMRMAMGLLSPTSGKLFFEGQPISLKNAAQRRNYWRGVQAIFQDPFSSFNQFFRIEKIFYDCIRFRGMKPSKEEAASLIEQACSLVNLRYAELENKYPFELSGGQMQRLMIARVFLLEPKLLIADEPTSMVDACSRSTILESLMRLRDLNKMTIIFITHDLGLAYYVSDTIYIMEKGRLVESGDAHYVINNPKHEYTRRLLGDVPKLHEKWDLDV
jgi:peptide/nickel transport system ATP-binding protein